MVGLIIGTIGFIIGLVIVIKALCYEWKRLNKDNEELYKDL